MATGDRDIKQAPQIVKTSKESIRCYVGQSKINLRPKTNGDIFSLTRWFVMDALERENAILDNPSDMYFWLLELRDEVKKSA